MKAPDILTGAASASAAWFVGVLTIVQSIMSPATLALVISAFQFALTVGAFAYYFGVIRERQKSNTLDIIDLKRQRVVDHELLVRMDEKVSNISDWVDERKEIHNKRNEQLVERFEREQHK